MIQLQKDDCVGFYERCSKNININAGVPVGFKPKHIMSTVAVLLGGIEKMGSMPPEHMHVLKNTY